MGPEATADFLRRLIVATPATRDQEHLHVITDCDPSVPDRTAAIVSDGQDPSAHLAAIARRLQVAGAQILVMPCNTAHYFAGAITSAVSVPLVNWPQVAADGAMAAGARRVGLLATVGTVRSGIYHAAFGKGNAEVILPAEAMQRSLGEVIEGIKRAGSSYPQAHRLARSVIAALATCGVDSILVACTELSLLAIPRGGHPSLATRVVFRRASRRWHDIAIYDAQDIVARHVVKQAIGFG